MEHSRPIGEKAKSINHFAYGTLPVNPGNFQSFLGANGQNCNFKCTAKLAVSPLAGLALPRIPLEHNLMNANSYFWLSFTAASSLRRLHYLRSLLGTFRSDYDYEYEYEFFNVYPMRMPDCVRLSRQLVLSSKSRRRLDANYEIFNKSRPPTTSSLQVQRRVKRLVFKGADTL